MSDSRSRTIGTAAMLLALVALVPPAAECQEKIAIGERHTVQSKILNEARPILVSLPDGYGQRQDRYPVLYLLDGDVHLEHVNGLVKFLAWAGQLPRMIVVGIANTDRMRDFSLKSYPDRPGSGGAGRFLEFLATELIPFVEKTYPTMPRRMLVGHSLCGSFALHVMLTRPDLFDAFIAISPGEPTADPNIVALWSAAERGLPSLAGSAKTLLLTVGDREEPSQVFYAARLARILEQKAPSSLTWTYVVTAGDNHSTLVHKSIEQGLLDAYSGWTIPQSTLVTGVEALKKHYAAFGYSTPPESEVNVAGYRLLAANQTRKAIEVFAYNVTLYPRSANVYDSLAEAYETDGQMDLAGQNYATAVRIAQETKDGRLPLFRQNEERFRKLAAEKKK